jgi:hypothetical protein
MPKIFTTIATATILLASSGLGNARAMTISDVRGVAPLTKSYTPVEKVGWRKRYYRRGYYRPYGYYGYGYRPYYGYGYRRYGWRY